MRNYARPFSRELKPRVYPPPELKSIPFAFRLFIFFFSPGRPLVYPPETTITAYTGQRLEFSLEFCANPPASKAFWITENQRLLPGQITDQFIAHNFTVSTFINFFFVLNSFRGLNNRELIRFGKLSVSCASYNASSLRGETVICHTGTINPPIPILWCVHWMRIEAQSLIKGNRIFSRVDIEFFRRTKSWLPVNASFKKKSCSGLNVDEKLVLS